jgi:hypothetical protein
MHILTDADVVYEDEDVVFDIGCEGNPTQHAVGTVACLMENKSLIEICYTAR